MAFKITPQFVLIQNEAKNQGLHLFLNKAANTFNGARKNALLCIGLHIRCFLAWDGKVLRAMQRCLALSPAKTC